MPARVMSRIVTSPASLRSLSARRRLPRIRIRPASISRRGLAPVASSANVSGSVCKVKSLAAPAPLASTTVPCPSSIATS